MTRELYCQVLAYYPLSVDVLVGQRTVEATVRSLDTKLLQPRRVGIVRSSDSGIIALHDQGRGENNRPRHGLGVGLERSSELHATFSLIGLVGFSDKSHEVVDISSDAGRDGTVDLGMLYGGTSASACWLVIIIVERLHVLFILDGWLHRSWRVRVSHR
jgi:hypothetical protein